MELIGYWYPADSSTRQTATCRIENDVFSVQTESGHAIHGTLNQLEISDRIGQIPRKMTFFDQSVFETENNNAIDEWLKQSRQSPVSQGLVHTLESKWTWVTACLLFVVVTSVSGYLWGLPWASQYLAEKIPNSVSQKISKSSLSFLDNYLLDRSDISPARQHELQIKFQHLTELNGFSDVASDKQFKLHFRKLGVPNAFALPSGGIVVTDQFINITENQSQIDAVLLHEMGHVIQNHGLQQLIQSSIITFVIAMMVGDPSGLEEALVAFPSFLLQSRYSRAHETEADTFALNTMLNNNIDPIHFAEALIKIDPDYSNKTNNNTIEEQNSISDYLSSHPVTAERIAQSREYSAKFNQ